MNTNDAPSGLRAVRERIGVSQATLAEVTGISVHVLGEIERGQRAPKPEELVTLSFALGVGPSTLLGLRSARPRSAQARKGLDVLDRFIDNCHYVDGLATLSGEG